MKNKTNVSDIREKYNLADDSTSEFDASTGEKQEFLEIEDVVFEDIPIAEVLETKNFEISEAPKLLNPTIRHKIVNKNRIDFLNCDFCSHSTSTKQSMERHMTQLHMDKSAKMFKCSVCPKTFAKKNILKSHEKIHLANRPTFDCQYCGKNLSSQTAVRNHIKWLHNEEREFDCSKCSKKFATVS